MEKSNVQKIREKYSEGQIDVLAELWGVGQDKNGKCKVNANIFLEKYINKIPTVMAKSGAFYQYVKRQGIWRETDARNIKRHLRSILHIFAPNEWNTKINTDFSSVLPLACDNFEKLISATRYINLKNGLLDLETFELKEHTPSIASLTQLPFDYDPKARCPKFNRFIREVFMEDDELILRAQEVMGYCLSPSTQAQSFFILYSDGSSGKSVFCSIMNRLAGGKGNVSSVTLSNLGNKFQRAELYGKILNISTENEASKFNTEALKSITNGDPIQVEHKFQRPFTARITAKLLFAMNSLPEPEDKTFAFYRRLVFLPFLAKFVDNPREGTNELQRNPDIEEELLKELQGILTWSIRGLKRLVQQNYQFTHSKEADKLMLEYRKDITPLFDFIGECIEIDKEPAQHEVPRKRAYLSTQTLFEAYEYWCVKNGIIDRIDKRSFLKNFREGLIKNGIPIIDGHSGTIRYFKGIHLTESISEFVCNEKYDYMLEDLYDDFQELKSEAEVDEEVNNNTVSDEVFDEDDEYELYKN